METTTEMDYPTVDELRLALQEVNGLHIEEETKDYFSVWDEFATSDGLTDRFLQFNKPDMDIEKVIESFGEDIAKYEMTAFLDSIPKILLMNTRKIYFVRTEEHLEKMYDEDESPNHTFDLKNLGMCVWADGTIIVNLTAHEEVCEEEAKADLKAFGFSDYEEKLKMAVWQTLVHELFHSLQTNPLFEEEIEQGEEAAENYCRELFA